jgi:hypothetical protein
VFAGLEQVGSALAVHGGEEPVDLGEFGVGIAVAVVEPEPVAGLVSALEDLAVFVGPQLLIGGGELAQDDVVTVTQSGMVEVCRAAIG